MNTTNTTPDPTPRASKPKHGKPYFESEDGGSWWIDLAEGYTVDGCAAVHERTKRQAVARLSEARLAPSLAQAVFQHHFAGSLSPEKRDEIVIALRRSGFQASRETDTIRTTATRLQIVMECGHGTIRHPREILMDEAQRVLDAIPSCLGAGATVRWNPRWQALTEYVREWAEHRREDGDLVTRLDNETRRMEQEAGK